MSGFREAMKMSAEEIPTIAKSRLTGKWLVTNVTLPPGNGQPMHFSRHESCVRWLELMAEKGRVHTAWVYRVERHTLIRAALSGPLKEFDQANDVMGGAR